MKARENANTEPPKPLAEAMRNANAICDYAKMYMIHTKAYKAALASGARTLCLTGMDAEMAIRCLANVDYPEMTKLGERLAELTSRTKSMRVTSRAGTDITFGNDGRPVFHM